MNADPDKLLREFLADRDVECPSCHYNLRDLLSPRCPECGAELRLSVGLVEPKQKALITGLIGLSAGLGLSGLLLVYGLIVVFVIERSASGFGKFFLINGVGVLVHLPCLLLWLKFWPRVRRMGVGARWTLAAACWVLSLAYVVIFALTIR